MSHPDEPAPADPRGRPLSAPDAVADHYRSVDSAPVEYSVELPLRVVNGFLATFTALGLLSLLAVTVLARHGHVGAGRDLVLFGTGDRAAIPVRVFLLVFLLTFGVTIRTNGWRRAVVTAELCGAVLVLGVAIDALALAIHWLTGATVPVLAQEMISAILALAVFPVVVLRHAALPEPAPPPPPRRLRTSAWLRLVVVVAGAVALAVVAARQLEGVVAWMRAYSILGGVGPGVFLVQQLVTLLAGGIGVVLIRRSRRAAFAPPLAVVVPAHNEAHGLAETVAALDRAAGAYAGTVRVYIVDNASLDDTAGVARRALASSARLTGVLLSCPTPGKAMALTYGFDRVEEPFIVRVDADAVLGEDCLDVAMRHFHDERVAVVGGLPLPARRVTVVDRVREVEVLVRHGYFQVARMGFEGIVGVPGMFTAFRRSALDRAGPLRRGMNGEDTDICLRLASLGYRCLTEPRARYRTEVPRTWAHLLEQRTRWFRSTYHVAAHNRAVLLRPFSMAGAVVMPFALWNAARRATLVPVLLYAVLVLTVFSETFDGLHWRPVVAMVVGVPALVAVGVCLLLRRPRTLLYVPEYLVFRLVRGYFTLTAVLSLRYPPLHPPWSRARRGRAQA